MNIRTFDKETSIHVINVLSLVVACGVTNSLAGGMVVSGKIGFITTILATPVRLADYAAHFLSLAPVSGKFNPMLFTLWVSYALIGRYFSHWFMVQRHSNSDLIEWYGSKNTARA